MICFLGTYNLVDGEVARWEWNWNRKVIPGGFLPACNKFDWAQKNGRSLDLWNLDALRVLEVHQVPRHHCCHVFFLLANRVITINQDLEAKQVRTDSFKVQNQ